MRPIIALSLVLFAASFVLAQHHHNQQQPSSDEYGSAPVTVTGYLRDTECLLKNPKAATADTDETRACLRACVRGGSPLGILTRQGELYTIFGKETPDLQLRSKLEPLTGHYVRATGWKVTRGGSQALVLKSIDLEK
jgi:hypothetical protein